jgi:hypothetical protein
LAVTLAVAVGGGVAVGMATLAVGVEVGVTRAMVGVAVKETLLV